MRLACQVDPLGFSETTKRLRMRLKKSNRMLLDPSSRKLQYWDMYMLLLLVYTMTVTPYEVCMMWEPTTVNALYVVNWFVNISFVLDIIFNFFLPYRLVRRLASTRCLPTRAARILLILVPLTRALHASRDVTAAGGRRPRRLRQEPSCNRQQLSYWLVCRRFRLRHPCGLDPDDSRHIRGPLDDRQ